MCSSNYIPYWFLYRKKTYIGNLPIQHIGTYLVGFWLIDSLIGYYSVLVTNPPRCK
jgi:hypothetical protein